MKHPPIPENSNITISYNAGIIELRIYPSRDNHVPIFQAKHKEPLSHADKMIFGSYLAYRWWKIVEAGTQTPDIWSPEYATVLKEQIELMRQAQRNQTAWLKWIDEPDEGRDEMKELWPTAFDPPRLEDRDCDMCKKQYKAVMIAESTPVWVVCNSCMPQWCRDQYRGLLDNEPKQPGT